MKTKLTVLCTVDKYGFKHPIEVETTPESAAARKAGMDSGMKFRKAFENGDVEEKTVLKSVEDEPDFIEATKLKWEWDGERWQAEGIEGYWFVVDDRSAWMGHRNRRLAATFCQEEEEEYPIDMDYGKRQCEEMHKALCVLHCNAYRRGQDMGHFKPLLPLNVEKQLKKEVAEGYDTTDLDIAKKHWENDQAWYRNRTRH